MHPIATGDDHEDGARHDAVLGGELRHADPARRIPGADRSDLFVVQPGPSGLFTASESFGVEPRPTAITSRRVLGSALPAASLRLLVLHVLQVRAGLQVSRVGAGRIVATVQEMFPLGDRSNVNLVGDTMGVQLRATLPASGDSGVALVVRSATPTLTGVGVIGDHNESGKAFGKGYTSGHHRAPVSMIVAGSVCADAGRFVA